MKSLVLLFVTLLGLTCSFNFKKANSTNKPIHWAVLVAGSNGYWNYRHQSDIFHAYQILIGNGINPDNIILFAYDDIAASSHNPFKGKVFNKPDPTGHGEDVYNGVKIDYKGKDVTPTNFLNVLLGKSKDMEGIGTGKVLGATENDNVFIYFSDHGATGLVAFPSEELYADDLISTLKTMHTNKSYKELVFYIEACESGSMFNNILPEDINVFATTASTPNQSSWAIYCSPDDVINKVSIGSCLGDEYSVTWMEDSDKDVGLDESLETQYEHVQVNTKKSQAQRYGTIDFSNKDIGQYQGNHVEEDLSFIKLKSYYKKMKEYFLQGKEENDDEYLKKAKLSVINSRDVKLRYLYNKAERENTQESSDAYMAEVSHIYKTEKIFNNFKRTLGLEEEFEVKEIKFDCLKSAVKIYKEVCNHWGEYDLKYVRYLAKACEDGVAVNHMEGIFQETC